MLSTHSGLTPAEVSASRQQHGSNVLSPRRRTPWWRALGLKFTDPLIVILLAAAVLSGCISCYEFLSGGSSAAVFFEPAGILVAVGLATGLAFWFERRADREFALLGQTDDLTPVRVVRQGGETQVPRRDVVVGDLVLLSAGDEVPADGRLLESTQMQVDESSLTGEPACRKSARAEEQDAEATFPTHMVLRGTRLLEGHGLMRVDAVGDATEHGRVFTEVQMDPGVRTPLGEQLDRLGLLIARASYAIAALVVAGRLVMWFVHGGHTPAQLLSLSAVTYVLQSLMLAVTLIVMAVPEGLPMAVTLALAYSMRRMLKTHNLVRRMHACETMGAATVICTDKTGTLTQNQMRVVAMHSTGEDAHLYTNIAVNSTASLDGDTVLGNPTEGALLLWLRSRGVDYAALRAQARVSHEVPFSPERKYMATRVDGTDYVKGAPEVVAVMCGGGLPAAAPPSRPSGAGGEEALRTLALAHGPAGAGGEGGALLHLDAVAAIADPVRPDVPAAVRECLEAGISVKIVTGDTPAIAAAIAREIGLPEGDIVSGAELEALSDEQLRQRAPGIAIVARARPHDKKRLVEALQAAGEVVAATGDGTNDAPALRAAHVGLSMGSGTAVAREASDITILDDSFASIGRAVMWGRSLYLGIQRFILFQLTVNVCACLTMLLGAFLGTEAPLSVIQMLWVNLIMDTFAAMALASLPPSAAVMRQPPRDRRSSIISPVMRRRVVCTGLLFFAVMAALLLWLRTDGRLSARDQTVFFTTFVLLQFWNLFNARAFQTGRSALRLRGCRSFAAIAATILAGQVAIVQCGGALFGVVPLDAATWLTLLAATCPVLLAGEAARLCGHRA